MAKEVAIWMGTFASHQLFHDYFEEDYGDEDDDDAPISAFVADQGEVFLDHDFMEHCMIEDCTDLADLLSGSDSESFAEAALAACKEKGITQVNACIKHFNASEIEEPRDAKRDGIELIFLGIFPYTW